MGASGLALVDSGWTGTIAVTVGALTVTHTPPARTSAAEVMAALLRLCTERHGGAWGVSASSAGVLTVTGPVAFTLAATLVTATRTGFSGSYTAATTYTAAGAHYGGAYPSTGVLLDGALLSTTTGRPVGDGSGGSYGVRQPAGATLRAHGTYASLWDYETDVSGVNDVWFDGRVYGRVHIAGWRRSRLGRLGSLVQLDAQVSEVRL